MAVGCVCGPHVRPVQPHHQQHGLLWACGRLCSCSLEGMRCCMSHCHASLTCTAVWGGASLVSGQTAQTDPTLQHRPPLRPKQNGLRTQVHTGVIQSSIVVCLQDLDLQCLDSLCVCVCASDPASAVCGSHSGSLPVQAFLGSPRLFNKKTQLLTVCASV